MTTRLQNLIEREAQKRHTHSVLLGVQSADHTVDFCGAAGDANVNDPYFIASVTKMYTVAVTMQLVDEGRVALEALISTTLPQALLEDIPYADQIKVYHLIHQTSGLADYFEGKPAQGNSLVDDLKHSNDRAYSINDVMAMVRGMTPNFAPDSTNKSHYSDTNYQLLGAVIEAVTGQSLAENFRMRIFDRLGLSQTYLYDHQSPVAGQTPLPFYNKDTRMTIPLALTSELGAGGIVSTLPESLRFLRAYFEGELFNKAHFNRMMQWNSLFFPMQYGYGLMRFKLPRPLTLFRYSPEIIGHSGSTGSFAFFAPKEKLYIAGTFNQADKPARPFGFMLKVVGANS